MRTTTALNLNMRETLPARPARAEQPVATPYASPVHEMQDRLQREVSARASQTVLNSFSAKQAVAVPQLHRFRTRGVVLAAGVGAWGLFFTGALLGLY